MLSLLFEGGTGGFDTSAIENWLERQGITKGSVERLAKGKLFETAYFGI
jgi:hypothetical protein